jgi:tetratricopeptide (TPR) repeat protein
MADRAGDLLTRAEEAYRVAVADPARAGTVAEAVAAEARRAGAVEPLVVALYARAWSARALLHEEHARRLLNQAARLAESEHLGTRLAEVLVVRAVVNEELGATRSAARDLQRARRLLNDTVPPELQHQAATLHQNAGRLDEAAVIYRAVLKRNDLPVDIRTKMANNLAMIEAQVGRVGVALALLGQARTLAPQVGPLYIAYTALGEAWVLAHAGRLPDSLRLFEEAERLFEDAGMPLGEVHAEAADAMLDLRLLPEARTAADRALHVYTDTEVPLMQAEAQLRVARVALLSNEFERAAQAAQVAVTSFRRQRRSGWAARAVVIEVEARMGAGTSTHDDLLGVRRAAAALERLGMIAESVEACLVAGRLAALLGRESWAVASFERAHTLARRGSMLTRLRGRAGAASASALRGDRTRAVQHCRQGLADLERHRGQLGSTELRVLASGHGVELSQLALRSVRASSAPSRVFAWMERSRAAALMSVQPSSVDGFVDEFEQLRSMKAEIDATGGASPALIARHAALEQRLRRLTWETTTPDDSVVRPTPVAELQGLLGGRVLVEYAVLDGQVLAAAVTETRVSVTDVGPAAVVCRELDRLGFSLRTLLHTAGSKAAPDLLRLARERVGHLRQLLIEPLDLVPDQEVVVVPIDVLHGVPWPALLDAPVSLSPSASFWASARRRAQPAAGKIVLAAGPGLTGATDEVRRLSALHEGSEVLCPPVSSVGRVAEALADAATAHFACHGAIRADNPMFSGLLLSDGYLTVQELELRNLAPYRVVLAACEASADVAYSGGELLGFVSALLARGTAGVLGSIQQVPDEAATGLMLSVHERLRDDATLATALHAARAELDLDDPADLLNWCGFAAYGAA